MAKNNFEEFNFQHYVDAVKQKRMDWNIFIDFMQDLSYEDRGRLRRLNAILLNELTINFSDIEKLKYLNIILLTEFKKDIQIHKEYTIEKIQSEDVENSMVSNSEEIFNKDTNTENESLLDSPCKEDLLTEFNSEVQKY